MDIETIVMIFKLLFSLGCILILIYIILKYGGTKMQNIQNGRFIKILEKAPLSKDNSILVVKIGEKFYVISSTIKEIKIIKELTLEEVLEIEKNKAIPQYKNLKEFIQDIYNKLKSKKEDRDE